MRCWFDCYKQNISIVKSNECTGCLVCEDSCPLGCIKLFQNEDGFIFPKVDENKCINCGNCSSVCPAITRETNVAEFVYSICAKDSEVVNRGSSGGVVELLSKYIFSQGGVVYGCAFDELLHAKHVCAYDESDLLPLLKSKYVQSDMSHVYSDIKQKLSTKKVFFVGTPCQVMALRNFVNDDANLYTVDLVCHGVPSQRTFDRFIHEEERKIKDKITNFYFRVKNGKYSWHNFRYSTGKGKIVSGAFYEFPFYYAYKKYLMLRESCYTCKFANIERVGDITLGDFWNINDYIDEKELTGMGVSLVLPNTKKGIELLCGIKDWISYKQFNIEVAPKSNACLRKPTTIPQEYTEFKSDLRVKTISEINKKYLKNKVLLKKLYRKLPYSVREKMPWKAE